MKRFTALLLVFLLAFSCGIPALADGTVETWEQMGFTLTYPEEFSHTKGLVLPYFHVVEQNGINTMLFLYFTFSREESDAYNEKSKAGGLTPEDTVRIQQAQGTLLIALAIDGGRGASELAEAMSLDSTSVDSLTPIKQVGDVSYFALTGPDVDPEYFSRIPEEYKEEYVSLQSALVEVLKNAEYFTPHTTISDLMGTVLRFETADLAGNPVKSEELFATHAVTLVNVWATWCKPCKAELPELGELSRRLAADGKDAAIVGICSDADTEPELCQSILAESKVDYLNLMPFEGLMENLHLTSLPTSFLVSRDGVIVLPPIVGVPSDLSRYGELINLLLGDTASSEAAAPAEASAPAPAAKPAEAPKAAAQPAAKPAAAPAKK